MKHSLTLHYSVRNGGDGSAYPTFMSSAELAEYDQTNMDEGWGESCTGSITVESDSPIIVKNDIETPEKYLIDLVSNQYGEKGKIKTEKFLKEFFPNDKPKFEVKTRQTNSKEYLNNDVFVDGKQIGSVFRNKKESGKKFEDLLNS